MSERETLMPGPCCICGRTDYPLSMGGPTICPKCDCGHFDAATVQQQAKVIEGLRAELASLRSPASPVTEEEIGQVIDLYDDHRIIGGYTYSETHVIRDHRRPAAEDRIWEAMIGSISHDEFQRRIKIERMRAALSLLRSRSQAADGWQPTTIAAVADTLAILYSDCNLHALPDDAPPMSGQATKASYHRDAERVLAAIAKASQHEPVG